jgi:hypothetical protein
LQTSVFIHPDEGGIYVHLDREILVPAVQRARDFAKFHKPRWQTRYKKGLENTTEDWFKAERIGAFGESAFHALTGLPIDEEIREMGNLSDFSISSSSGEAIIEVKTTQRYPNYKPWLTSKLWNDKEFGHTFFSHKFYLKAQEPGKQMIPLRSDYYVFAILQYIAPDNLDPIEAIVQFYGWIDRGDLEKYMEVGPSPKKDANHLNYYIHVTKLRLMEEFLWTFKGQLRHLEAAMFI